MRTTHRALCAASIALASILAFSCNNAYGIFSNVQDEVDQKGTKVFQKTPVSNAFRLGSKYYAAIAGGTLQARDVGTTHGWNRVSIGGGSYTLRSAVLAGDAVAGTIFALIERNDAVAVYHWTIGDTSWTEVATLPTPALSGDQTFDLDALFAANGEVYAEGHIYDSSLPLATSSSFTLYHYDGASSLATAVTGFAPAAGKTIRGVVYDGGAYWYASEDLLHSGNAADGSADESGSFTNLGSKSIWGISFAGGDVYVTTKDGAIYQNGTPAAVPLASIPLTCVIQVPGSGPAILLVGSDALPPSTTANGYYEGVWGGLALGSASGHTQVALNSSIFSTTVSAFPVHAFFYDSAAQKVFICVSPGSASAKSYGLYSSDWDGFSWSGWLAE